MNVHSVSYKLEMQIAQDMGHLENDAIETQKAQDKADQEERDRS